MSFLTLLPLAVVMIAGPQIRASVLLATSEQWQRNSAAFLLGAALSMTVVVTAAFFVGKGARSAGAPHKGLYAVIVVLLLAAMLYVYAKRTETQPPKWMSRLATTGAKFAFLLGFLLLGVFPTDILTSLTVGSYVSAHSERWWRGTPFVGLTLLLLALPALTLFAFGSRAETFLPKAREWMTTNAWIINEVVLTFFVAIVISNLAG